MLRAAGTGGFRHTGGLCGGYAPIGRQGRTPSPAEVASPCSRCRGSGRRRRPLVDEPAVRADGVASPPPHEPVPAERLNELEAALSSPDTAVQAEALDPAIFASLQASGQPLLPAGSTLEIDTDRSQIVDQTATVGATVSGPQSGEFTLLLALEDGVWFVFAPVPA
jgi:hypothetical protein